MRQRGSEIHLGRGLRTADGLQHHTSPRIMTSFGVGGVPGYRKCWIVVNG